MPDENLLNLMFSLGKTIYPSFPTHGIINKMLVMHYYALQTQVMNEMQIVAQSLGVNDEKTFGEMLQAQCNPVLLLRRSKELGMRDAKEQKAMKISLLEVTEALRRYYSIPSSQLPFTSLFCSMTLSNPEDIHSNSPDISAVRKGMTYPIDLSAPNAIPPQSLGD